MKKEVDSFAADERRMVRAMEKRDRLFVKAMDKKGLAAPIVRRVVPVVLPYEIPVYEVKVTM